LRRLVEKYRLGKIKSVIHFRRIVEAHENTKGATEGRKRFLTTLEKYIQTVELETRAAFDGFVEDTRKVNSALQACEDFVITLKKTMVEHVTERREDLIHSLREARTYIDQLLSSLEGSDDPRIDKDEATAADDELCNVGRDLAFFGDVVPVPYLQAASSHASFCLSMVAPIRSIGASCIKKSRSTAIVRIRGSIHSGSR